MNSTALYRHFADDGSLLYVGISLSWPTRTKAHARGSAWFSQVTRVEIEQFDTREAALAAERDAIKRECPKFNVIHNGAAKKAARSRPNRGAHWLQDCEGDTLLAAINGPNAIVGPALVYRENDISVMIAHGEYGTEGHLTEVVLGGLAPEAPDWVPANVSVILMGRAGDLTMDQAKDARRDIIQKLTLHLHIVESFDTDIALAVAYATRFPSQKSREILDQVAVERGSV